MCLFAYFCVYPCMFAHIRNCLKTIRRAICCRTVPSRASGTPCGSSYGRFCILIKNGFQTGFRIVSDNAKPVWVQTGFGWNRFCIKPVSRISSPKPVRLPVSGSVCGHHAFLSIFSQLGHLRWAFARISSVYIEWRNASCRLIDGAQSKLTEFAGPCAQSVLDQSFLM